MAGKTNGITTHVLDTALGKPAPALKIALYFQRGDTWELISEGETNTDGRCPTLMQNRALEQGRYRIEFDTEAYFLSNGSPGFYPYVHIVFDIRDHLSHYHVPLLLSPFGYSTYRGS